MEEGDHPLPDSFEFFRRLLIVQLKSKLSIPSPKLSLTENKLIERLEQGKPTLTFAELTLDWAAIQSFLREVIGLVVEYLSPTPEEIENLNQLTMDYSSLKKAVEVWFDGGSLSAIGVIQDETQEFLIVGVLQATLQPQLAAHSEVLLTLVNQELWRRKYCPVCGGKADFAFLDKERGARWLLCSRCDAEWLFQRLECPYCGTYEQSSLAYLTDDAELYRLYTCEECHSYIKAIDLRKAEAEVLLPLERIMTVDLDRQAEEAGYRPG